MSAVKIPMYFMKKDTSGKEPKAPLLLENVMRRILQQGFPVTGNHCLQDVPIDISNIRLETVRKYPGSPGICSRFPCCLFLIMVFPGAKKVKEYLSSKKPAVPLLMFYL